ncbi:MAG: hypothetical protein NZ802_05270, partial [Candidatus Poseidoniales archaeon]|nr:hypothetical protein [Candidatus Poseidoniales archaeon]
GLDRLTGSQTGQMLLGGFILAALLIGLLMYIVRRNAVVEPHWDDEYDIFDSEVISRRESSTKIARPEVEKSLSRRSRRKLTHQRQQERIRAMEDATEAMAEETVSVVTEQVAESTGVLQAMEGTVQGQTGWYQTAQGESQYWQVDAAGQWSQVK